MKDGLKIERKEHTIVFYSFAQIRIGGETRNQHKQRPNYDYYQNITRGYLLLSSSISIMD